ncbi:MAG TPA: type III pantothenate kinase [Acidimicrobiales bacterium]|nr:type III pantothenate kinase [Acidimicrobiales bacterium]
MLLVIDVGNTQTVLGMYGPEGEGDLAHHWRVATVPERTAAEHAMLVAQLLDLDGRRAGEEVSGIAVCSVVPRVTAALRLMIDRWYDVPAVVVEPGTRTGIPILYDNPKEVGADRIADAVGAHDLYGCPCIVVDFGTATTVDAVSNKGEYLGGAILPGIEVSLDALFERAAALRRTELAEPRRLIGRSTVDSIRSGAVYGFAAAVDGLCRRMDAEIGPATVVATGGLAEFLAPLTESIQYVEPWLTLHGLRLIYRRNLARPA